MPLAIYSEQEIQDPNGNWHQIKYLRPCKICKEVDLVLCVDGWIFRDPHFHC